MSRPAGADQPDGLQELAEALLYRLDFLDVVIPFALLKRAPELLALEAAPAIACCAELKGLADECRGTESQPAGQLRQRSVKQVTRPMTKR